MKIVQDKSNNINNFTDIEKTPPTKWGSCLFDSKLVLIGINRTS